MQIWEPRHCVDCTSNIASAIDEAMQRDLVQVASGEVRCLRCTPRDLSLTPTKEDLHGYLMVPT